MFALGILDCAGCGMTCRSSYHLNRHVPQCRKCLARDHALHIIRQAAVGAAEQHAKRPRINPPVGQALLPRVVPLLRPLRHPALDPITLFGNERTFVYFCYTLHAGQFSHKKADTAIAFEHATTDGSREDLLLSPRGGLQLGYDLLDGLADRLGISFKQYGTR